MLQFAFDRYHLTAGDHQALEAAANWLKAKPNVYVTIAGNADERGSIVYSVGVKIGQLTSSPGRHDR